MEQNKKIPLKKAQPKKTTKTIPSNSKFFSNRNFLFLCLGFAFVFFLSYKYIFDPKLSLNGDNYSYLLLSKSIAQGHGYTNLYSSEPTPASHFPPGYSAILSVFMFLKINDVIFFKVLNGLFLLASVCLLAYWMKSITKNTVFVLAVGVLILLNRGLLSFATIIMSEMPYLFFTCLSLFGLVKLNERDDFWKSPYFYLMAVSAVIAYYIRSIALALLVSVFLYYLIQKRWKISLGFLASVFVLYLPWVIRNHIYGIKGRYMGTVMVVNPWRPEEGQINSFGEFFEKMLTNFNDTVVRGFTEVLFPFININSTEPVGFMEVAACIIILFLIFYGAWNLGKYRYLIILYILGNIGTFLLWHGGNGARYVHPLSPFLSFPFFWGIIALCKKINLPNVLQKAVPFLILLLSVFFLKPLEQMHANAKAHLHPAYKNYFAIAKSLNPTHSTKINDKMMVCCRKPDMFSYYSNCLTGCYLYSLEQNEVLQQMIDQNVDYVVLEQLGYSSTGRYLYPVIQSNPELFTLVTHLPTPDTYLLTFEKEKAIEKLAEFSLTPTKSEE